MFNEYSFVPRSAILNGLGSLRILPYCPSTGGTRPIKERWRGGQEKERERERYKRGEGGRGGTIDVARFTTIAAIGNRANRCCVPRFNFISPLFYDNISPHRFRIYRVAGEIWRAAGCVATR